MGAPKLAPRMQQVKAARQLEELRGTLIEMEDNRGVLDKLSPDTQDFYRDWMNKALEKVRIIFICVYGYICGCIYYLWFLCVLFL